MKRILNILSVCLVLFLVSCEKNTNPIFEGEFSYLAIQNPGSNDIVVPRVNDGVGTDTSFTVVLVGTSSNAINVTYEIDPSSTATENLHYTFSGDGTVVIPAGQKTASIPYTILDDNITLGEVVVLTLNIVSADIDIDSESSSSHSISVDCVSDISGTANYRHYDNFGGAEYTGQIEIETFGNNGTDFTIADYSFGLWEDLGFDPDDTKGIFIIVECGVIRYNGRDKFGEVWSIEEVLASNGPEFTFKWANGHEDFGTVTLTKEDGSDWPLLQLQ